MTIATLLLIESKASFASLWSDLFWPYQVLPPTLD